MAVTTTRYSNAAGIPLTQKVGATASVLLPDPQGNVIGRIDSNQVILGKTWYWPYGELRTGALGSSLGYGGMWGYYTDNTSNRIYIRARYLKPNYTRWLTVDPVWPNTSAYVYVADRPIVDVDPTGKLPLLCAVPCIAVSVCIVDIIAACADSKGFNSFMDCAWSVFDNLPSWTKALCGGGLMGCLVCLSKALDKEQKCLALQRAYHVACPGYKRSCMPDASRCNMSDNCGALAVKTRVWESCCAARLALDALDCPDNSGSADAHEKDLVSACTFAIECAQYYLTKCGGW